ncbi:MAG: 4-(cytidine 5'-diphospho)-2-C-methyl-D-erythritol kinase, partial [Chitinophagaceae bacterium]
DCPFFIYNQPAFASGRGEMLQPVGLDLNAYSFLIVNPGIHISTAQAFSRITPNAAPVNLAEQVSSPIENWKELVRNDFEDPAFYYHPDLREIKSWLYEAGALYASMTGSGSCFYGIFPKNKLPVANLRTDWDIRQLP